MLANKCKGYCTWRIYIYKVFTFEHSSGVVGAFLSSESYIPLCKTPCCSTLVISSEDYLPKASLSYREAFGRPPDILMDLKFDASHTTVAGDSKYHFRCR